MQLAQKKIVAWVFVAVVFGAIAIWLPVSTSSVNWDGIDVIILRGSSIGLDEHAQNSQYAEPPYTSPLAAFRDATPIYRWWVSLSPASMALSKCYVFDTFMSSPKFAEHYSNMRNGGWPAVETSTFPGLNVGDPLDLFCGVWWRDVADDVVNEVYRKDLKICLGLLLLLPACILTMRRLRTISEANYQRTVRVLLTASCGGIALVTVIAVLRGQVPLDSKMEFLRRVQFWMLVWDVSVVGLICRAITVWLNKLLDEKKRREQQDWS